MTARPYGEVLDEMDHEAKYLPATSISLGDILTTLKHARIFISTRERMHASGIELYDELIKRIECAIHPAGVKGGGPTETDPNRPYCKPDQSCCDFCCGN